MSLSQLRWPSLSSVFLHIIGPVLIVLAATPLMAAPPQSVQAALARERVRRQAETRKDPAMYPFELGRLHERYKRPDRAIAAYAEAAEIAKTPFLKARILQTWAELLAEQKQPKEAKAKLLESIEITEDAHSRNRLKLRLGHLLESGKDLDGAYAVYSDLMVAPDINTRINARRRILSMYVRAGKRDVLIAKCEAALVENPLDEIALALTITLYTQGKPDLAKALQASESLADLKPHDRGTNETLASLYIQTKQLDKAEAVLVKLIKRSGAEHQGVLIYRIVGHYRSTKQHDKAMEWAKLYVAKVPKDHKAWALMAELQSNAGNMDEAAKAIQKALSLARSRSDRERFLFSWAMISIQQGDRKKATPMLTRLAASAGSHQMRKQARAQLDRLQPANKKQELHQKNQEKR
jgi:tetratricopeptide (TPR) repeat protein